MFFSQPSSPSPHPGFLPIAPEAAAAAARASPIIFQPSSTYQVPLQPVNMCSDIQLPPSVGEAFTALQQNAQTTAACTGAVAEAVSTVAANVQVQGLTFQQWCTGMDQREQEREARAEVERQELKAVLTHIQEQAYRQRWSAHRSNWNDTQSQQLSAEGHSRSCYLARFLNF